MQPFPTQYSLLAASALKDLISLNYDLKVEACKLLIHNVSDTYLVSTADERYIFRVYRKTHRSLEEIKGEFQLLSLLKAGGAGVSYPVNDLSGKNYQEIHAAEGIRYAALFTFAEGAPLTAFTTDQLRLTGREMAKMHNISAAIALTFYRKPLNMETIFFDPISSVKPAFKDLPEQYGYLFNAVEKIKQEMDLLNTKAFTTGYCHYDVLPKNFHVDGEKITFFDFDFAGQGWLVNDLSIFFVYFFLDRYYRKMSQEDAEKAFSQFLESYQEVRKLTADEIKAIPYLGFGFFIFFLKFQHDNFEEWSNFFFGPRFLKERTEMLKTWMEWYIDPVL